MTWLNFHAVAITNWSMSQLTTHPTKECFHRSGYWNFGIVSAQWAAQDVAS
jgi:hypothetical protein